MSESNENNNLKTEKNFCKLGYTDDSKCSECEYFNECYPTLGRLHDKGVLATEIKDLKNKIEEWANSLETGYTHCNWNDIKPVIKKMMEHISQNSEQKTTTYLSKNRKIVIKGATLVSPCLVDPEFELISEENEKITRKEFSKKEENAIGK